MSSWRRIAEFFVGVLIVAFLLGSYCTEEGCGKLVTLIVPTSGLQLICSIALVIVSVRLIAGKPKDYSKYFYRILVRIFGDPTKLKNQKD